MLWNHLFTNKIIKYTLNNIVNFTGSHKGTGMSPLYWIVPKEQSLFQICNCKYTKDPPFCDATHVNLPCEVLERQANCSKKTAHVDSCKLCTKCGWVPDFWPENNFSLVEYLFGFSFHSLLQNFKVVRKQWY